ncbi:MAG: hypothetical protein KC649_00875 [Candidatus Omnitrophica bacterium]|nr:hypothetical protein [Candidatus Omnitrophota bacterium]
MRNETAKKNDEAALLRMKRKGSAVLLLLTVLGITGCAHTVLYSSDIAPEQAGPLFREGTAFYVQANDNAQNPVFDKKMREKIERVLYAEGYSLVLKPSADYILTYNYGVIGSEKLYVEKAPGIYPTLFAAHSFGGGSYLVQNSLAYREYSVETHTVYKSILTATVYKNSANTDSELNSQNAVWSGESMSENHDRNLRNQIDYLLVAIFEGFGEEKSGLTKKQIKEDNSLLTKLRQNPTPGKM